MGVLNPAKLRALAAIPARLVGLNPLVRNARRDQVALAVEIRDPEAMDDVVGRATNANGAAHGNVDLVGGDDDLAGIVVEVANVPPPLVADDFDNHAVLLIAQLGDRLAR